MFCLNIYGGQGEDFYLAKDYKNAEIAFIQDLEQDPSNLKKLYNLAQSQYALGEYEKAYNTYEELLAIVVENDDIEFQDRIYYDLAIVSCMHAKSLASSDIRTAHAKSRKSMEFFRELLRNASTNERIPNAFLYQRKLLKELNFSLAELEERESFRAKIKEEFIKEISEEIELDELVLAHIAQKDFELALSSQETLIEKTKNFLPKIEALSLNTKSELIDTQEFEFLMQALFKSILKAFNGEEQSLLSITKENATSAETHSTSVLIDLNAALAMLKGSTSSLNSQDGEEGSESSDYEEDEDYDEDYEED